MSTTVTLTATASAYVTTKNKTQNKHGINTLALDVLYMNDDSRLLLVFPGVDASLQYKGWSAPVGSVYGRATGTDKDWRATFQPVGSFDPTTVTWNTKPSETSTRLYSDNTYITGSGWKSVSLTSNSSSSLTAFAPSLSSFYMAVRYVGAPDAMTIYGTASSYKPKIEVTFDDDDAYLKFKSLNPADGSVVVSGMDQRFSWTTEQSMPTVTELTQTSATFQWKRPSDAGWTDVSVSGNTRSVTIPAGTFSGGKIEWRVVMTDVTGHTRTSSTQTAYTTATLACTGAAIVGTELGDSRSVYDSRLSYIIQNSEGRLLAAQFSPIPTAIRGYKLIQTRLRATFANSQSSTQGYHLYGLADSINSSTVKYSDLSMVSGRYGYGSLTASSSGETTIPSTYMATSAPTGATTALKNALASRAILTTDSVVVDAYATKTYNITGALALEVAYDDTVTITSQVAQSNCPTSGWVNAAIAQTFAWTLEPDGDWPSTGDFIQSSGSLFWSSDDGSTWTEAQASGSTQQVTIPANTFPGGTIKWYISATDTAGTTSTTEVYVISTEDTIPTATPKDPVSVPATGNKPIVFRWTVANDSGTQPTASELQTSTDGSTWTALTTISGSGKTYTAPANTFAEGTVYWRVRAYNRDNVAGSWSSAVSFLCISASAAPVVTVNAVPFATVSWQGSGQQAYRITVDGTLYGPYFGTDKTFTLDEPLTDGQHTAAVEIQNLYGLWSDAGSATFTVTNVPGDAVTLTGTFGVDARLSWETGSADEDFLIYRDGVRIGHTVGFVFVDRLQVGDGVWQVMNRLSNGNYILSNMVLGTTEAETCWITAMDGSADWLELKLTQRSQTEQNYSYSRVHSLRHVSGAALPVLELSAYEDRTASFDTAFLCAENAKAFEALRGKVVILKVRNEEIVIGALTSIRKTVGDFYRTYEFTVSRIHWEDYVDDTDS